MAIFAAMIIGFTERIQTVSEGDIPGVDVFQLQINVASLRTSESEHRMEFRLQESRATATVETLIPSSAGFDATFGLRDWPDGPIYDTRYLAPGLLTVPPLQIVIRNDVIPEDRECFTISIFPVDVPGRRELFTCNEDFMVADCNEVGIGTVDYLCEHTICIEDDDGE